ncbi:MAG TPA: YtxH domain-containing protein [Anaerolineaceae bacterium]|nr:YtxH domain-containing protein [Anaerolineaceae bacterium]
MRGSNFFSGLLIGALIGSAVALLYTPASGKNLRSHTRNYVSQIQQEMKAASEKRRAELEQELSSLRAPKTASAE